MDQFGYAGWLVESHNWSVRPRAASLLDCEVIKWRKEGKKEKKVKKGKRKRGDTGNQDNNLLKQTIESKRPWDLGRISRRGTWRFETICWFDILFQGWPCLQVLQCRLQVSRVGCVRVCLSPGLIRKHDKHIDPSQRSGFLPHRGITPGLLVTTLYFSSLIWYTPTSPFLHLNQPPNLFLLQNPPHT